MIDGRPIRLVLVFVTLGEWSVLPWSWTHTLGLRGGPVSGRDLSVQEGSGDRFETSTASTVSTDLLLTITSFIFITWGFV